MQISHARSRALAHDAHAMRAHMRACNAVVSAADPVPASDRVGPKFAGD